MPVVYTKLFNLLEKKGYTTYKIRKENLISNSMWKKLKDGTGGLGHTSIGNLCRILDCQPCDIMEYVPDEDEE